jgi:anti-sigma factor RsiW
LNPNIDKQEMKNYLLGTLEADRRTELEEKILCDPEVYEELLVTEEELIDQYVGGGLSKLERRQFETHFLITVERQKNLRFGKLLNRYLTSHPPLVSHEEVPVAVSQVRNTAPAKDSFPFYLAPFHKRPVLVYPALVIAAVGIVFFCWLATRKPADGTAEHNAPQFVVVTLAPGSIRSSGVTKRVSVPPKGVDVKLELELANPSFQKYKSQLFRESESLVIKDELKMESKGDQHIVPLTITGEILTPGDYQVKLSGVLDSGADEFIDHYSFRVIE